MLLYVALARLLLLADLRPVLVTDPVFPLDLQQAGTVVATLVVEDGVVREVAIQSGEDQFARPVEKALKAWRFPPDVTHASIPVVTHFRTPLGALHATTRDAGYRGRLDADPTAFEPKVFNIQPARESSRDRSLAYPIQVVEPIYPDNAVGQGAAVLRLEIDKGGKVRRVEALKGLGAGSGKFVENAKVERVDKSKSLGLLTDTCVTAAGRWRFSPAENNEGAPIDSEVLAICVYRFLILPPPPVYMPQ